MDHVFLIFSKVPRFNSRLLDLIYFCNRADFKFLLGEPNFLKIKINTEENLKKYITKNLTDYLNIKKKKIKQHINQTSITKVSKTELKHKCQKTVKSNQFVTSDGQNLIVEVISNKVISISYSDNFIIISNNRK